MELPNPMFRGRGLGNDLRHVVNSSRHLTTTKFPFDTAIAIDMGSSP